MGGKVYDRRQLTVDRDPLKQLAVELGKLPQPDPLKQIEAAAKFVRDFLIDAFRDVTGIDLSGWAAFMDALPGFDASKIISGLFSGSLIPGLDASKIVSGSFPMERVTGLLEALASGDVGGIIKALTGIDGGDLDDLEDWAGLIPKLVGGFLSSSIIPGLDASKIVSGLLGAVHIPELDATKITSGQFPQAMLNITNIAAGIVSGIFNPGQIPAIDASKIVSGTLDALVIPDITREMSSDVQAAIDGLINATRNTPGVIGQAVSDIEVALARIPTAIFNRFSGNNVARASADQANAAMAALADTVSAQGAAINALKNILDSAGGFSANVEFRLPETLELDVPGTYTYDFPVWSKVLDIVAVGAGGAGRGMSFVGVWGEGGKAGQWATLRLVRGVNVPQSTTQIQITVGKGNSSTFGAGNPGDPTVVTITGYGTLTAAGGAGGSASNLDTPGKSPGNITFEGELYIGGAQQNGQSATGNAPGGGGGGSRVSLTTGGIGGAGRAWIKAMAELPAQFTPLGTLIVPTYRLNTGVAQTDSMTAAAVWTKAPQGAGNVLIIRANAAFTTYVYLRVWYVGSTTNYEIGRVTSGVKSAWKTGTLAQAVPFNEFSITSDSARTFTVSINGTAFDSYTDTAASSSMGANFRNGGWGSSDHNVPGSISQFAFLDTGTPARITSANVLPSETMTGTSYANLATLGPSVTLNVPPSGEVLIGFSCRTSSTSSGRKTFVSFEMSGANTAGADDTMDAEYYVASANTSGTMSNVIHLKGLNPGTTTFKLMYRTDGSGTAAFYNRKIWVEPKP